MDGRATVRRVREKWVGADLQQACDKCDVVLVGGEMKGGLARVVGDGQLRGKGGAVEKKSVSESGREVEETQRSISWSSRYHEHHGYLKVYHVHKT